MPVNYKNYHPLWKSEIRPNILKRADNRCEHCGVRNYSVGERNEYGHFIPIASNLYLDCVGHGLSYPSLLPLTYAEAAEERDSLNDYGDSDSHFIVIVLTIAHLDHNINNNNEDNLAALCQRCHLIHDVNFRAYSRNRNKNKDNFQLQFS